MSKDNFIDQKIAEFQDAIKNSVINNKPLELHRALRFFAKEVERETRHKAADMAMRLSAEINNL